MPRTNSNTKERIFNEAVRLFSEKSFAVTAVRDISSAAGINEASLYYHFENKADILDEIMNLFRKKLKKHTLTKRQIDNLIESSTPRQILQKFVSYFSDDYASDTPFMWRACRIVCMEQFTNQKARDVVINDLHEEIEKSLEYALDRLIEREKIPGFDTHLFSTLWVRSLFSETVILINGDFGQPAPKDLIEMGEHMIDMAMSGGLIKKEEEDEAQ